MSNEDIILSDEQKDRIREIYKDQPDLIEITRKAFDNEELDGRSKEGRAVRAFLVEAGLKYKTTKVARQEGIVLDERQKAIILQNCKTMTAFQLGKLLFPEATITSVLSKECRAIISFVRSVEPESLSSQENAIGVQYCPPNNISEATALIEKASTFQLCPSKLSTQHKQAVQAFLRFINSPRVIQIINSYASQEDRELFETEFTRFTWDKPDLTADDLALYIGTCQDIVLNKRLVQHRQKLDQLFENVEEDAELSIRLAETMKAKASEYDQVQSRISSTLKKLSGDRAVRMQKQGERATTFLSLVEAFQAEEERKILLLNAKAQTEKIKNETDRLESLDDFIVRIVGISKQEAL